MIDFHTHLGRINFSLKPLTVDVLISKMDELGIKKSVVLPIENPEETHFYSTTEYVISECDRYPDRLLPFCNLDPRRGIPQEIASFPFLILNPYAIIKEYVNRGCRGFGECLQGLPIDDPRSSRLYEACGKLGLPVILHITHDFINYDEVGLPGLERLLKRHSDVTFIAHAAGWWSEISSDVDPKIQYPSGRVKPNGRVDELLERYDNLFADLSGYSAHNALIRDLEFAREFLERNRKKILFGTDHLFDGQELPIVELIKTLDIGRKTFRSITTENAQRLLNLS